MYMVETLLGGGKNSPKLPVYSQTCLHNFLFFRLLNPRCVNLSQRAATHKGFLGFQFQSLSRLGPSQRRLSFELTHTFSLRSLQDVEVVVSSESNSGLDIDTPRDMKKEVPSTLDAPRAPHLTENR